MRGTKRAEVAVVQRRNPIRSQTLGGYSDRRVRSPQWEISVGAHQASHTAQIDEERLASSSNSPAARESRNRASVSEPNRLSAM